MDKKFNLGVIEVLGGVTRGCSAWPKQLSSALAILIFFFSFVGCSPSTPDSLWPTSEPAWSTPKNKIDGAERIWNRKRIRSYSIQVRVWGFWHEQNYTVVVRDGKVVDSAAACAPVSPDEPCQVHDFDPENFTVPGLFAVARAKATMSKITFDPDYGFPSIISYNDSRIADEEEEWSVLEFHPEDQ